MHERSLAQALIQQIDDELQTRRLCRLREVHLEIGEFAGVEPLLLESAFEELAANHWPAVVRLQWKSVPLTARCQNCVLEFRVERFRFVCPVCGHRQVDILAGEELKLVSLQAETTSLHMSGLP
jgi:hydrogenase nickel incorporation protein HypA/HybF